MNEVHLFNFILYISLQIYIENGQPLSSYFTSPVFSGGGCTQTVNLRIMRRVFFDVAIG
jgi:hypothetical protein